MKPNPLALQLQREALGPAADRIFRIGLIVGASALVVSYVLGFMADDGLARFAHAYLVSYCFFLSLALGAQIFILLQHLTRARWSVAVRRLAEMIAASMPILAILFIPILLQSTGLYEWAGPDPEKHLGGFKGMYFGKAFVIIRIVLYFLIWILMARFFLKTSISQDRTGDPELTRRMEKFSAPGTLLWAFTVTYFAFDIIMSLDVHWYSTIFGVYFFSGALMGFLALLVIVTALLQRGGLLVDLVTTRHYHDIGRLLFAFTLFWAYIAFSQYMLIWYANIPEETVWIDRRQNNGWGWVGTILIFGHFLLPFCGLLSRHMKRRLPILVFWSVWILAMHWVDFYWLIIPEFTADRVPLHLMDATCFIALAGFAIAAVARTMPNVPLIPARDPRLFESLALTH